MAGRVYAAMVGVLVVAIGVLLAVLLDLVGFTLPPVALGEPPAAVSAPSRSPDTTAIVHPQMAVPIPADADCGACHLGGGFEAIAEIPTMAHPIEGWRNCTACHVDGSLVATAPGHTGIGKELCLACHEAAGPGSSALPRPHHVVQGTPCLTCHGPEAPLPTDMVGRTNCWVCHPDADSLELFGDT